MSMYFHESLQDLFMQTLKKDKALRECKVLEERYLALKEQTTQLASEKEKEEAEAVKAKENFFLSHFAKGKVDKEALEAYVAQEKYEVSCKELELVEKKLQESKERLQKLGDCDIRYQNLYEKVRAEILAKQDERAQTVLETEAQIASINGHLQEVEEAYDQANKALAHTTDMSKVIDELKAGGYWSVSIIKRLNEMSATLNVLLEELKVEMQDISLRGEFGSFYVSGNFGELFFDGLMTSFVLEEMLYSLSPRLGNVRSDIYKAREAIEAVKEMDEKNLADRQKELKTLIEEYK